MAGEPPLRLLRARQGPPPAPAAALEWYHSARWGSRPAGGQGTAAPGAAAHGQQPRCSSLIHAPHTQVG